MEISKTPNIYVFQDDNKDKPPKDKDTIYLKEFLVQSLGISFSVCQEDNKWEWASLLGGEKRVLLRKLPELLYKFLPENKIEATKNLWKSTQTSSNILVQKKVNVIQVCSKSHIQFGLVLKKLMTDKSPVKSKQ